jgi:hypothetical protein
MKLEVRLTIGLHKIDGRGTVMHEHHSELSRRIINVQGWESTSSRSPLKDKNIQTTAFLAMTSR